MEVHSAGQEMPPCLTWYMNPQLVLSLSQLNPVHSLKPCLRSILVFVCHLNITHEVCSGLPVKIFYVFTAFLTHVACPAHLSGFDHYNSVKSANYKYLFSCCYLLPRFNKWHHHYCQTLAVSVFLLNVQGQVAHPWWWSLRKYSKYSFSLKCFCSHYICYDGTKQITFT